MTDRRLFGGAGNEIDRDVEVMPANAVLPFEKGVLFTVGVEVEGVGRRLVIARMPDTPHSPRLTRHGGGTEPSIYKQSEIVEAFMKRGNSENSAAGRWNEWSAGNFRSMIAKYSHVFTRRLKAFIDEGVKQARRDWIAALRNKKAQDKIRPLKEKIKATYEAQREHARLAKQKVPDFDELFGSGSIQIIEAAKSERQRFMRERRMHKAESSRLFKEHRSLVAELRGVKALLVRRGKSKMLADEIEAAYEQQEIAQMSNDQRAMKECQERIDALTMPFQMGASIGGILERAAKMLREDLFELLMGMKSPPIATKTAYNRRWRGYDTGNRPLVESGEFAASLMVEVI